MSVILIGMPSSGKSTVGVILAKQLGYDFIDGDLEIQQQTGELLWETIKREGAEGFVAIESGVNSRICNERAVIATGGSAVYGEEGMKNLRRLGVVVYLEIEYDEMVRRLGNYEHRGIVIFEGRTLGEMYAERRALYEKYADVTVRVEGESLYGTVEKIINEIKNKKF